MPFSPETMPKPEEKNQQEKEEKEKEEDKYEKMKKIYEKGRSQEKDLFEILNDIREEADNENLANFLQENISETMQKKYLENIEKEEGEEAANELWDKMFSKEEKEEYLYGEGTKEKEIA